MLFFLVFLYFCILGIFSRFIGTMAWNLQKEEKAPKQRTRRCCRFPTTMHSELRTLQPPSKWSLRFIEFEGFVAGLHGWAQQFVTPAEINKGLKVAGGNHPLWSTQVLGEETIQITRSLCYRKGSESFISSSQETQHFLLLLAIERYGVFSRDQQLHRASKEKEEMGRSIFEKLRTTQNFVTGEYRPERWVDAIDSQVNGGDNSWINDEFEH